MTHPQPGSLTRRQAISGGLASVAVGLASGGSGFGMNTESLMPIPPPLNTVGETIVGSLSGKEIFIPNVGAPPIPSIVLPGIVCNGLKASAFEGVDLSTGYPDACSFKRRFGLLIPATNTAMEYDLWSIVFNNQGEAALDGVGLHTTTVITPKPDVGTAEGRENFKRQFLGGVKTSTTNALLAAPQYLILGLSLEHILSGLPAIHDEMEDIRSYSNLSWAFWEDAAKAALKCYGAKRIGLLTPWEKLGNASAVKMFEDMGVEVVATAGFSCGNIQHIAHIPDWAKEKAVLELLATKENKLDAIVQCGTNMSMMKVTEKLEPRIGIPILAINPTIFWYALRENGFKSPLVKSGRLLREF